MLKSFFVLLFLLGVVSLYAGKMTLQQYLESDHNSIKKIISTLKPCEQVNYRKMLKLNYKKIAKQHLSKVKKFCAGKLPAKKIKYKGKNYEAYIFYSTTAKCEAGTKWFLPKADCSKLAL